MAICANTECPIPWCHEHVGFETYHRVPESARYIFDRSHLTDAALAEKIEASTFDDHEFRLLQAEAMRRWLDSVREVVSA